MLISLYLHLIELVLYGDVSISVAVHALSSLSLSLVREWKDEERGGGIKLKCEKNVGMRR